jgi:hypothetical protein
VSWEVADSPETPLRWWDLPYDTRDALFGKLAGLWGAATDEAAFDALTVDKQQALLLILLRLQAKNLWPFVKKINNVYGEGGVGIGFDAWPGLKSTFIRRKDFTRLFANHKDTDGGFYEKRRSTAVLHFLYQEGNPLKWYLHFDLYSPVHTVRSGYQHMRHEFIAKLTPDWRMIRDYLDT